MLVVWPQLLQSLSHVLLTQIPSKALHQSIKGEKDDIAGLVAFSVRDSCVSVVCGLAAWLAIASAVVFMTARAMLQSVLRGSEQDNCSRAIVAAATRYLPRASLCMFVFVCVCLPLRVLI